jgi:hypothetical protein
MFGTKFSAIAMAAVRIAAAGAVGMAVLAGALLIVGPALPGHGVAPWLISAHPRVQAGPQRVRDSRPTVSRRFELRAPTGMPSHIVVPGQRRTLGPTAAW